MLPKNLRSLTNVTDNQLAQKRKEEIESYTAYFDAVLQALQPDVVRAFGSGYFWELNNDSLEVQLYGQLFPTLDPKKLWHQHDCARRVANDYGEWSKGKGELLVARLIPNNKAQFVHTLQDGKHGSLMKHYNPRYESLDEPKNYNDIWVWPISEYSQSEMTPDFFRQRGFSFDAEPQTLYERVLTPGDVAKHPLFAKAAQIRIEEVSKSALDYRTRIGGSAELTTQQNYERVNRILKALERQ